MTIPVYVMLMITGLGLCSIGLGVYVLWHNQSRLGQQDKDTGASVAGWAFVIVGLLVSIFGVAVLVGMPS